jgi:hypothetical protein
VSISHASVRHTRRLVLYGAPSHNIVSHGEPRPL